MQVQLDCMKALQPARKRCRHENKFECDSIFEANTPDQETEPVTAITMQPDIITYRVLMCMYVQGGNAKLEGQVLRLGTWVVWSWGTQNLQSCIYYIQIRKCTKSEHTLYHRILSKSHPYIATQVFPHSMLEADGDHSLTMQSGYDYHWL